MAGAKSEVSIASGVMGGVNSRFTASSKEKSGDRGRSGRGWAGFDELRAAVMVYGSAGRCRRSTRIRDKNCWPSISEEGVSQ